MGSSCARYRDRHGERRRRRLPTFPSATNALRRTHVGRDRTRTNVPTVARSAHRCVEDLDQRHPRLDVDSGCGAAFRIARSEGTPSGSRRSRRCDRRSRRAIVGSITPGFWMIHARHRPASITPGAMIAPVGQASIHRRHEPHPSGTGALRRRQRCGGDDATEHEPASCARQQDVGVLAEPPDSRSVGDLAIDHRVVVGEGHRPPAVAAATGGRPFASRLAAARSDRSTRTERRVHVDQLARRVGRRSTSGRRRTPSVPRQPHGCGSVDRCGFLYVNCNPSCSPASLRRISSSRARCSTSASHTPTCEMSCCAAISTRRRRIRGVNRRRRQRRSHCDAA